MSAFFFFLRIGPPASLKTFPIWSKCAISILQQAESLSLSSPPQPTLLRKFHRLLYFTIPSPLYSLAIQPNPLALVVPLLLPLPLLWLSPSSYTPLRLSKAPTSKFGTAERKEGRKELLLLLLYLPATKRSIWENSRQHKISLTHTLN